MLLSPCVSGVPFGVVFVSFLISPFLITVIVSFLFLVLVAFLASTVSPRFPTSGPGGNIVSPLCVTQMSSACSLPQESFPLLPFLLMWSCFCTRIPFSVFSMVHPVLLPHVLYFLLPDRLVPCFPSPVFFLVFYPCAVLSCFFSPFPSRGISNEMQHTPPKLHSLF